MTHTTTPKQTINISAELKKITYTTPENLKHIKELAQQFLIQYCNEENIAFLDAELKSIRNQLAEKNIENKAMLYSEAESKFVPHTFLGSLDVIGQVFDGEVKSILKKYHENIYTAVSKADLVYQYNKQAALKTLLTATKEKNPSVTYSSLSGTEEFSAVQYAKSIIATKQLVKGYAADPALSRETTIWEKLSLFIDDLLNPAIKLKDLFSEPVVAARSKVNMFAATAKKVSKEVEAISRAHKTPGKGVAA